MSKIGDVMSKIGETITKVNTAIVDAIAYDSTKEASRVVRWENSAGQTVQSTAAVRDELRNVGQAHIDSYASYAEVDKESKLSHARSISKVFSGAAERTRIIKDVLNGDNKFHFTVKSDPKGPASII